MAKKTLKKMLEEYTATSESDEAARRLAIFLAYWDEIEDAYKNCWSWLQIHSALLQEGVVDYPYTTFLYYKNKKCRREMEVAKREAAKLTANGVKSAPVVRSPGTSVPMKDGLPTFTDVSDVRKF
jgi:hypothetical protein